ncbi:MAG: hypothetical protein A2941_02690 [Candidatus Yanofskybacteria bacterium RIFCSPLOWO2_01_FULL_49_17]|uniref:Uncharacterized protein n=1 Tax=Candidatus Yanofskybacteria bacterium RIFCSPLOWO2_01_FULL_49_17 TaxID=1802700 RepID=A0A1F8GSY9_9BACT|nr:MAG: hypothetical protein A2941_02690 [Candidatus Yanofskybacteria bacterium RIFCSPLOWO2_01_FULL_49_17]
MTASASKSVMPVPFGQFAALMRTPVLPTPQQLFDYQVETLVGHKLAKYEEADRFRNHLMVGAFLFVPAHPKLDNATLEQLMALIVINGKSGKNYLDADYLKDEVAIPTNAHLMVSVEDGNARRNIRPSDNRKAILAEGRQPYNVWRGIVHVLYFPEVLQHHYLDLVASRCESGRWPSLFLYGGQPGLGAVWDDEAYSKWGTPSCGSVVGG